MQYKNFAILILYLIGFHFANAQNWQLSQQYTPTDVGSGNLLGKSLDIEGNFAITSAHRHSPVIDGDTIKQSGAVYIFEKDGEGDWQQVQKIAAPDAEAYDYFGISVGISGTTAVVGAHYNSSNENNQNIIPAAGAVYVFEHNQNGSWEFWQKLTASDKDTLDWFGESLSIHQNRLIIGAPGKDENIDGINTTLGVGAAYVFEKGINGYWQEQQKIGNDQPQYKGYFGKKVLIYKTEAVISGNYDIYVYKIQENKWIKKQALHNDIDFLTYISEHVSFDLNDDFLVVNNPYKRCTWEPPHSVGFINIYEKNQSSSWSVSSTICEIDSMGALDPITGLGGLTGAVSLNENNQFLVSAYERFINNNKYNYIYTAYLIEQDTAKNSWLLKNKFNSGLSINGIRNNSVALTETDGIMSLPLLSFNQQPNAGAVHFIKNNIKLNTTAFDIESLNLNFYPNPFKHNLYIDAGPSFQIENINLYNSILQPISYAVSRQGKQLKIEIDQPGLYFLMHQYHKTGLKTYKIIKQ